MSSRLMQDSSTWILPRRGKSYGLEGMISRFSPALWGSTGVAMLVVAVTLMAAGNRHWALNVWGSVWEQSADRLPRNTRVIWILWLLLCLHLAAAYRTALVSLLTNPLIHQINSVEELVDDAGLKLGMRIEVEKYLDKNDETQRKILARYIPCKSIKKCFMEVPEGRAVWINTMYANYLNTMENVTVSMLENIRHLTTHNTYKVAMIYAKGHAVSPIFDKYVLMLLQAGFAEHLVRETEFLQKITNARKRNFADKKPLSFANVREGFYLLAVGLTVAGLSFFYETFQYFSKKAIPNQIGK
ncbi:uncharacterized protein LOC124301544 [Neodiprion virginianus]|uniref:uncharacterized protein LOC124301544 n=1 Tax=Neodiprion virginianus TaxID=2961670 RepID=UPI001EE6D8A6|nr:uncharacterized protein LOC124301544 [Neodiprion virginianus]